MLLYSKGRHTQMSQQGGTVAPGPGCSNTRHLQQLRAQLFQVMQSGWPAECCAPCRVLHHTAWQAGQLQLLYDGYVHVLPLPELRGMGHARVGYLVVHTQLQPVLSLLHLQQHAVRHCGQTRQQQFMWRPGVVAAKLSRPCSMPSAAAIPSAAAMLSSSYKHAVAGQLRPTVKPCTANCAD